MGAITAALRDAGGCGGDGPAAGRCAPWGSYVSRGAVSTLFADAGDG
eukprot:gene28259-54800_t